jgi:hypothetical protein
MLQTKVVETIITHVSCSIAFFENRAAYEVMWKNTVEATDDNMAHEHCMLGTQVYKHTLRICNTYCFPLQQRLHKRSSVLCYTYIAGLTKTGLHQL